MAIVMVLASACTPKTTPMQQVLPRPDSAEEAALIDLHPLTTSGLAWFGDWSPDGQTLIYTVATAPFVPIIYGDPPDLQVWRMRADGSLTRFLTKGHSPFFGTDGRTVFFEHDVPNSGLAEMWAVGAGGGQPRRLVKPIGGLTVHRLNDGRLVVSEWGTYAPLRVFDPKTGDLSNLTGRWPTNFPQKARLSPDGTCLAYPHEQERIIYLAEADGSQPQAISPEGGFGASVWWSPDSRFLAYTTGNAPKDRLVLADRDGETLATLLTRLQESGYVSTLDWSPDSRMLLVTTDAYSGYPPRPTHLYLFDTDGRKQLLLETYLHDVAWSPDGRTLALSRWDGPQGELASHNIWLATLTDRTTVDKLPSPTPEPTPTATPSLPLPSADLGSEEVIHRFWEAIDTGDYITAWACLSTQRRARQGLAVFRATWQCVNSAKVENVRLMEAGVERQMFEVRVSTEMTDRCFDGMGEAEPFTVLVQERPNGLWLIDSFNTSP